MLLLILIPLFAAASAWHCVDDRYCPPGSSCMHGVCRKTHRNVCPEHMHFESCGSSCQPTCTDPDPKECDKACHAGCVCDKGFVLDGSWHCVNRQRCPKYTATCGPNEDFTTCGSPCESTCKEMNPKGCPKHCMRNVCQCHPGFYRHPKKGCVDSNECTCENEENFVLCVNNTVPCELTCENPNATDCTEPCINSIMKGTCRCKTGLVRHAARGCIPLAKCNVRVCGENEHYTSCGSACEPSCSNPVPDSCPQKCIEDVCQCNAGYYRHETRGCILIEQCRVAVCGRNEHFTMCGSACEPTCERPRPRLCTGGCVPNVCQCNAGYFRHKSKGCITLPECGDAVCGQNEFFTRCGTACEPTCENPAPKICTDQCVVNACQCKKGFYRNIHKKCVPLCECPGHGREEHSKGQDNEESYKPVKHQSRSSRPKIAYVLSPKPKSESRADLYPTQRVYYDRRKHSKYLVNEYVYL